MDDELAALHKDMLPALEGGTAAAQQVRDRRRQSAACIFPTL
jgi:hypothetical protein